MKIVWVIIILKADFLLITGQYCNGTYDTLPDLDRRGRNYVLGTNEAFVSDAQLQTKWYKVGLHNMPTNTTDLKIGMCGTYYPIWMNGTIPGALDGKVARKACTLSFGNVCNPVRSIEVINCQSFMMYKLVATAQSSGYCFDSFQNINDPPNYRPANATVVPELYFTNETGPVPIYFKPRLKLRCDFPNNDTDTYYYRITWYVNDIFFNETDPQLYSSISKTNLLESELLQRSFTLGITIQCSVRASRSVNGMPGNRTVSPGYWMGIEVINPHVFVQQGKTAIVQLRATFPFGCQSSPGQQPNFPCILSVQMYDPYDAYNCTDTSIAVQSSQSCSVAIRGLFYHELMQGNDYTNVITNMTITTKDTNDYNPARNRFVLKLVTESVSANEIIIRGYYLADINVVVEETSYWKGKLCYVYIDPHMQTFDGMPYENQNEGVFILYKHISSKQEVQIWTTRCWGGGATCTCAIAVRAGGDVFMINLCTSPRLISFVSCAERILQVRRLNLNWYKVFMPLGTEVSIDIWNDVYLNIVVYPSVRDVNETRGLCGFLNDNTGDDFIMPSGQQESDNNLFSTSWRIGIENSFFNPSNFNPTLWDESTYHCVCPDALQLDTTPSTASGSIYHPLCSASLYLSCTEKIILDGTPYQCDVITKRSETSRTKELVRIFARQSTDNDKVSGIRTLQKRQTRTYTFEAAFNLCTSIFNANCTTAFEGSLPEKSKTMKNGSLSNCALDMMYTGDTSLADVHCETYRTAVNQEISRNSTYRAVNPGVVSSFRSVTCKRNCNFHGDCINGSCSCHKSYLGEDCSVSSNSYPDVEDTFNGGLCQRDGEDCCGNKPVYGIHIFEGITSQKSEILQRYADGTETVLETIISNVTVKNKYACTINVPCHTRKRRSVDSRNTIPTFVSGIRISLTNDGKNYGTPQTYFMYDSRCQGVVNATNGIEFYLINGTCFIDDECYNDGYQNPTDSCKSCKSFVHPYSWTDGCIRSTNIPSYSTDSLTGMPSYSTDSLTGIVVPVVSSVAGLVMLVVSTIVIIKCCFKKETKVRENYQANIMATSPGNAKFQESALQHNEERIPDSDPEMKRDPSYDNNRQWGDRPGTAKEISLSFFENARPL